MALRWPEEDVDPSVVCFNIEVGLNDGSKCRLGVIRVGSPPPTSPPRPCENNDPTVESIEAAPPFRRPRG
jgi:hypothetical protein